MRKRLRRRSSGERTAVTSAKVGPGERRANASAAMMTPGKPLPRCTRPSAAPASETRHDARMVSDERGAVLAAIERLLVDCFDTEKPAWDNATLPAYLGALAAWLRDSDGYYAKSWTRGPERLARHRGRPGGGDYV